MYSVLRTVCTYSLAGTSTILHNTTPTHTPIPADAYKRNNQIPSKKGNCI